MKIRKVTQQKKQFLDLLLSADEQESMIDRYLDRGDLYALYDDDLKTVCVVTYEGDGVCEVKNIATQTEEQGKGYGKALLLYVADQYRGSCRVLLVGTGETPRILRFYESCGFRRSHVVKDFFTDNYDHPIVEDGVLLRDMIYLKMEL